MDKKATGNVQAINNSNKSQSNQPSKDKQLNLQPNSQTNEPRPHTRSDNHDDSEK